MLHFKNDKVGFHARVTVLHGSVAKFRAGNLLNSRFDIQPLFSILLPHFDNQSILQSGPLVACRDRAQRTNFLSGSVLFCWRFVLVFCGLRLFTSSLFRGWCRDGGFALLDIVG